MQWRKQGDRQWQSVMIPLKGEGNQELVYILAKYQNQYRCASCGRALSETAYLSYKFASQTTPDARYCVEHSPFPTEIQGGPTVAEHVVALFQHVTAIGQRIAALEQRVAELEGQKGSNQDSPGEQESE